MRHIISILALVVLASSVSAQGYITVSKTSHKASTAGAPPTRDFWFAIPQNYDPKDVNGEVFSFYITSPVNTTVNIQVQGQPVVKKPVTANQVLTHIVPRNLEINRSSAVETDKAIHIWSDNADLNVYFMSRNDFTSDGTVVLPSYSYGKEYVVAAATALYVSAAVDLPSEFIVIATKDSTVITITPSQDIRKEGVPTEIKYPKNVPFNVTLNKGECIQYQTTQSQDLPWDLSGTKIYSTEPIAVIGASACPFIPADPYCDHVLEMIPPVDTWGKIYYSSQFAGRQWGGDSFLAIASKDNQSIYRKGILYATLSKFETYLRDDITGSNIWTSDAPFLLVQYINSALYSVPLGQPRNSGDPAMAVLYPAEQAQKDVTFQTPSISPGSGQAAFTNYVNILLRTASVPKTMMDGKVLTDFTSISRSPIPGTNWEAFRIEKVGIGRHSITSDSGICLYAYGYGPDESYAWSVPGTLVNPNSSDTLSPVALVKSDCYCVEVNLKDTHPTASKLMTMRLDGVNFRFDNKYIKLNDSAKVKVCLIDSSSVGSAALSVYDNAGNRTTISVLYSDTRYFNSLEQKLIFGTVPPTIAAYKYAEIQNFSLVPDSLLSVSLQYGNRGFTIDSIGTLAFTNGEVKNFKIRFSSANAGDYTDTLIYTANCQTNRIPLIAGTEMPEGKTPDSIYVGCIPVGDTLEGNVIFTNANTYPLTIIAINQSGDPDFVRDGTPSLPLTVAPSATAKIGIRFNPLSATQKNALLTVVYQTDDAIRDSVSTKLAGCGLDLGVEDEPEIHTLPSNSPEYTHAIERLRSTDEQMFIQSLIPNPASGIVKCVYAIDEAADVSIELLDMLGKVVARPLATTYQIRGVYEVFFDVSKLPSGSYIARISGGGFVASGRVIVSH